MNIEKTLVCVDTNAEYSITDVIYRAKILK
jgi:hypothetical protein